MGLIYQATHQSGRLVCWAECRQIPIARRTYQERAFLTRGKHRRLDEAFRECAHLYNAALEEWRNPYRQAGIGRTCYDQAKELTATHAQDHFWGSVSIQVGRGVLRRLERARQALSGQVRRPAIRSSSPAGAGSGSRLPNPRPRWSLTGVAGGA